MEAAAKARASAEAALTKAAYAKQQSEMKKKRARLELQKAELEANLESLKYEREAEAEVLEAAVAMGNDDIQSLRSAVPPEEIQKRIAEYVQCQSQITIQFSALTPHNEMRNTVNIPPCQSAPGSVEEKPPLRVFKSSARTCS